MNLANMMDYHHFPIYSVMILFLGAFIIAACGSRASKNPKTPRASAPGSPCAPRP